MQRLNASTCSAFRTLSVLAVLSGLTLTACITTPKTEVAPKATATPDACLIWEPQDFAASPAPETAANTKDTDETVAGIRKKNAVRNRYCKP